MKISDILESGDRENFKNNTNKILLFLGFGESQVRSVLSGFPKKDGISRPIFCGLTEQNIDWTMEYLIEHLLEEEKYWAAKKKD